LPSKSRHWFIHSLFALSFIHGPRRLQRSLLAGETDTLALTNYKLLSRKTDLASRTHEAARMPVLAFKLHKLRVAFDGLLAVVAALRVVLDIACATVRRVLVLVELLTTEFLVAVLADEALRMERGLFKLDRRLSDDFLTDRAFVSHFLEADIAESSAVVLLDELVSSDGFHAVIAREATFVEVFVVCSNLLLGHFERLVAVMAVLRFVDVDSSTGMTDALVVHKREVQAFQPILACTADEALLVIMPIFHKKILALRTDGFLAVVANVCNILLVALEASWMIVDDYVFLPRHRRITREAAEMFKMPRLLHGAREFADVDQLFAATAARFDLFSPVPATVQLLVVHEVNVVDQ